MGLFLLISAYTVCSKENDNRSYTTLWSGLYHGVVIREKYDPLENNAVI